MRCGAVQVGFDFADDESKQTTLELVDTAAAVHQMGLPLTVHTGEGLSVDHIQHTLDCFGSAVRRLGHATTLLDSPSLVERVRREGIAVESCLTSNFLMGTVPSMAKHPLPGFVRHQVRSPFALLSPPFSVSDSCSRSDPLVARRQVKVTVNTDDPTLFGTDMNREWLCCLEEGLLSREELLKANATAREVSFVK
jgi:adenosine deaminase